MAKRSGRVAHCHEPSPEPAATHQADEQGAERRHHRDLNELGLIAHRAHEGKAQPPHTNWRPSEITLELSKNAE